MATRIYDNSRWDSAREEVLARDGNCVLSWLGPCSGRLHVHHVSYDDPYNAEKLVAVCEGHHPSADRLRRHSNKWKRCTHHHPTREGREACERRLNSV
jgi:hypothetical protein